MDKYFAAFIITYERVSILPDTIEKILSQSFPPQQVLIVDNSETRETLDLIASLHNPMVVYHRVGHNAGPAGAAKIGLQKLADEGYQWIYWGDDNDPPKSQDCYEKLFHNLKVLDKPGIIGAVGHALNTDTMFIRRTNDQLLQSRQWIEVDAIAGGMCMIINAAVVRNGVLPDEKMFYGFEELDFCIRVQKAGFSLWVLSELFVYYRQHSKRPIADAGKRGLKKKHASLWREYYSTRNTLYITKKNHLTIARILFLIKSVMKSIYGFRFGARYGVLNAKFIVLGINDYFRNRMGRRILS